MTGTLKLVLLNPDMPCLYQHIKSRSEEANSSGAALFVVKYVNLYQQRRSSNLIGCKLEVGVAAYFIQQGKS